MQMKSAARFRVWLRRPVAICFRDASSRGSSGRTGRTGRAKRTKLFNGVDAIVVEIQMLKADGRVGDLGRGELAVLVRVEGEQDGRKPVTAKAAGTTRRPAPRTTRGTIGTGLGEEGGDWPQQGHAGGNTRAAQKEAAQKESEFHSRILADSFLVFLSAIQKCVERPGIKPGSK